MLVNTKINRVRLRKYCGPSKITVPEKANPLARLVFAEMKRQRISYDELEAMSGVLRCSVKAWRAENQPGLASISAALGALGWDLVAVPQFPVLPPEAADALETLGRHLRSDQAYAAALMAAASYPEHSRQYMAEQATRNLAKKAAAQ